MDDLHEAFGKYVTAYHSRKIPPPHILLIGPDEVRNAAVATTFAKRLGMKIVKTDAAEIRLPFDLTTAIIGSDIVFMSNIQRLKKSFVDTLERALPHGEHEVLLGEGAAAKRHMMDISHMTLVATSPTKYECPSQLFKVFELIIAIEPPTEGELFTLLKQEAWKDRIELDPEAAELLVRVGCGRTGTMLHQFRRVCSVIEQLKMTNRPVLSGQEVADALERLRIKLPPAARANAAFNIHALSGQEFEHVIKALLTEMGFEAELTEVTGDGGIDIIAKLDKPFVGGRYLVQCKRYSDGNMVGASEVRDFYGAVMADRAVKGIFITTSDFTSQAKEFATQSGIEIVNLSKLMQLFKDSGLKQYL